MDHGGGLPGVLCKGQSFPAGHGAGAGRYHAAGGPGKDIGRSVPAGHRVPGLYKSQLWRTGSRVVPDPRGDPLFAPILIIYRYLCAIHHRVKALYIAVIMHK